MLLEIRLRLTIISVKAKKCVLEARKTSKIS